MKPTAKVFSLAFLFFAAMPFPGAHANLEKAIAKLPDKVFCVNADVSNTWEAAAQVLSKMEIIPTLADESHHVITTAFVEADYKKMLKIAKNPRPASGGRFTMKISLEEVTPSFTKLHVVLQVRQKKLIGGDERLLRTRGTFEKYIAFQINQKAVARQYPHLYEIRLGMALIPNLKTERYELDNVEKSSPAGEAGFKTGDVLMAIDDHEITIRGELFTLLDSVKDEKEFEFRVQRNSREIRIRVWVLRVRDKEEKIGIQLDRLPDGRGLVVRGITPDSRAEVAGLKTDDILSSAEGVDLHSWTDFYRAMTRVGENDPLRFKVKRGGQDLELAVGK